MLEADASDLAAVVLLSVDHSDRCGTDDYALSTLPSSPGRPPVMPCTVFHATATSDAFLEDPSLLMLLHNEMTEPAQVSTDPVAIRRRWQM